MDFLTGMAYWGIILLAVINAIIVSRMKVVIHGEEEGDDEKEGRCSVG
jgi:prolipoprotein diacylglyceryltransferase